MLRSLLSQDVSQGLAHFQAAIVSYGPQLSESIHEHGDARARGANHLRQNPVTQGGISTTAGPLLSRCGALRESDFTKMPGGVEANAISPSISSHNCPEQCPNPCRHSHCQRAPKRDAGRRNRHSRAAHTSGQPAQERKGQQ